MTLDELESIRLDQSRKIKEIEERYYATKENKFVGSQIRMKLGFENEHSDSPRSDIIDEQPAKLRGEFNTRAKKSVKISEVELGPKTDGNVSHFPLKSALSRKSAEPSRSRSRSLGERKRSMPRAEVGPVSPRRQIFEAKFDKFIANKQQKIEVEYKAQDMEK